MAVIQPHGAHNEREKRAVASALWSASGDAIGWITELGDAGTVKARAGVSRVEKPVPWVRRIGGMQGVKVDLRAGTYSDDTQLRLAVCRAIRGDGVFDAEAFARVELTTWQGYALGAGRGSKAAASNLTKRGVNWFSNFFENKSQTYVNAGGNGAAMRVQPHAWRQGDLGGLLLAVMRDSLITHGHPHGFVGAVYHAVSVSAAMNGKLLDPLDVDTMVDAIRAIPAAIENDRQLSAFWRPAWEDASGHGLEHAIERTVDELRRDVDAIRSYVILDEVTGYASILDRLELRAERYRGSGLKTALAASALAWLCRKSSPETALVAAANELHSDTDTIATMTGALLGAVAAAEPEWAIQDRDYIVREAKRVASIGSGTAQDSFTYPDLLKWRPPATQSDAVVMVRGEMAIAGLGVVEVQGKQYQVGDAIWQWMMLPFGQTVLAKRRANVGLADEDQMPRERRVSIKRSRAAPDASSQAELDLAKQGDDNKPVRTGSEPQSDPSGVNKKPRVSIDEIADQIISSDFDPVLIGRAFHFILERRGLIEDVSSLTGILARARLTQIRNSRR